MTTTAPPGGAPADWLTPHSSTYDLAQLGEVSGAFEACDAALVVLRMWLPVAVQKVNAAGYTADDGSMPYPRFYGKLNPSVIDQVADQVPAVMVSSPGTTGAPQRVGSNGWSARYVVNVTVVDRGQTFEQTSTRIQLWAALVRQVLLGNRTLRGRVQQITWTGETFGAIPDAAGRTYAGCTVACVVQLPVSDIGDIGSLTPDPVYDVSGIPDPLPPTPVGVTFEEEWDLP